MPLNKSLQILTVEDVHEFTATHLNQLWLADLTYATTWAGFVYVAFIIDVFSWMTVGWRMLRSLHSDRGVQRLSIRYTKRLAEASIEPSAGSAGDSYDNALAETIIGLYKTESIHQLGPWRNVDHVEFETLDWVNWFNNRRLLEPLGNIPPAEREELHYQSQEAPAMVAGLI